MQGQIKKLTHYKCISDQNSVCEMNFCGIIDQSLFYIDRTTLYTKFWKFDID
jgi:hypothetical protein